MANRDVTVKAAMFSVPLELCILLTAFHDIKQDLEKGRCVTVVVSLQLKPLSRSDAHSSASHHGTPAPTGSAPREEKQKACLLLLEPGSLMLL